MYLRNTIHLIKSKQKFCSVTITSLPLLNVATTFIKSSLLSTNPYLHDYIYLDPRYSTNQSQPWDP